MTIRLIKLGMGARGITANDGICLTDAEISDATVVGPDGFIISGLTSLYDICHDYSGNLYIADQQRHVIVKVTEDGEVRWLAGSRNGVSGNNGTLNNVPASDARFNVPYGICCDKYGTIYVADGNNHQIRTIRDGKVGVLAGSAGLSGFADGNGTTARFSYPYDVTVDKKGIVYVADGGNSAVRKILNNGQVVTIAGNGNAGDGIAEYGTATAITGDTATWPSRRAMFTTPDCITVDPQGNIYIADSETYRIKKITPDGQVHLYSGSGIQGTSLGTGNNPSFNCEYTSIFNIDSDESGNIYVVDNASPAKSRVIKIDPNGKPSEIADFSGTSYNDGPWSISCTPAQKLFIGMRY